jgi:hypothetical protein
VLHDKLNWLFAIFRAEGRIEGMGMSKICRQQFFAINPTCIFCGGSEPAKTIEHCPPKAMFDQKQWPEGYEFPACEECNCGSSDQDLIIAWMARIDYTDMSAEGDTQTTGLLKAVHNQNPKLIKKLLPSALEAKRTNRELGIKPAPGKTHAEAGVVNITPEMKTAVHTFSKKLTKAVYRMHTQKIFPADGCLMLGWFTNVEFVKESGFIPFNVMNDIAGITPPIERTGKSLDNRFRYKFSVTGDSKLFALQAMFGNSFGLIVFGCAQPGQLEGIINKVRMSTDKVTGALTVLQSSLLTEG